MMKKVEKEEIKYLKKYLKNKNLEEAILELESGIPIQYVIGDVSFYGNKIKVNSDVLIPRFETELLVFKASEYIHRLFNRRVSIIDIGTGSGCIAISLAKLVDCDMSAIDISSAALSVARENALINNVDIKFIHSDLFSDVFDSYDVIISNPPYISYDEDIMDIVRDNEPDIALYASDNGLYFYKKILSDCYKYLNEKFLICFEIGYKQGEDIKKLALKYLKDVTVSVEKDYSGRDRFVFIWN